MLFVRVTIIFDTLVVTEKKSAIKSLPCCSTSIYHDSFGLLQLIVIRDSKLSASEALRKVQNRLVMRTELI